MLEYSIQTVGLTKQYGNQLSVNNLNLNVKKGSIYGLLGRNGAGKSTTMKMILNLIEPTKGTIRLFGKQIDGNEKEIYSRIGCLIESPGFYPNLTGTENLKIFAMLRGIPRKNAVQYSLETVGLSYNDKKLFSEYSLGMKQRLALALAIMHDPELLILDEPINGLDPIGIVEIRDMLREFADRGKTILISSHILSEIELLADDIGIINEGMLIEEESMEKLKQKNTSYIGLQTSSADMSAKVLEDFGIREYQILDDMTIKIFEKDIDISQVIRTLVSENIRVYDVHLYENSLEDYFKTLTGGKGIG